MKRSLSTFGIVFVLSFSAASLQAQDGSSYKSGIGLRAGGGYYDVIAASFKTFVTTPGAVEINLGFRPYGITGYSWFNLSGSASYQHHFPIGSIEGFRWFVGGGATVFNTFSNYDDYKGFGLGIFPTGGVDYKFGNIPLNVSADIRPTISVIKPYKYYNSFYAGNAGVSARYTF
ncbi:hypothetical protein [Agriterribacter sp.]|uniref:hypothetical protein n=1 Tax=Agriterribacter sp. TaxID=2821509 RepID=UPI002C59E706|nr:hypothetical protein [Agriterribacter sp.]HRP55835.1 hypothetical protein [Agriterribacter sp.]